MDIVTTLVAVAIGATLAAVFSALLGVIKEFLSGQQTEARIIIKKGHRTVAVLNSTDDEVDQFLLQFKSVHQDNTKE